MKDIKKTLLRAGVCLSLLIGVFATDAGAQTAEKTAVVEQRNGFYLFFPGQKPTAQYEIVQGIESPGMVKSTRHDGMVETMLKVAAKVGKGNAIIFTEPDLGGAIVVQLK